MQGKPRTERPKPQRSLCMCGDAGSFLVTIDVQELVLDRDDGISSRPYWIAKYRTGTRIDGVMCTDCVKWPVQVQVSVSAKVEKAQEVP